MRPENLDPDLLAAQTLKISVLRLINAYETPCDLNPDDWQFGVYSLVLILGRLRTAHSREALLDLLDFVLPDVVFHAIATAVEEDRAQIMPLLRARIGKPLCREAGRKKPYLDVVPLKNRDRQLRDWDFGRDL